MKTKPIRPADPYAHPQAPPQPQPDFLHGNQLPARWRGRARFVVLETAFGLGHQFLTTWNVWRMDTQRCERLVFVAIDEHPPHARDLVRAHQGSPLQAVAKQLVQAWPPPTPNLHSLHFEDGAVHLLLAWGELAALLPALHLQADAFFVHALAAAQQPGLALPFLIKALGRKAAAQATLAACPAAPALPPALRSAGFEVAPTTGSKEGHPAITQARYAPRFVVRATPRTRVDAAMIQHGQQAPPRSAVVVGAGLAGAAVARALAQQGLRVTVLEAQAAPALQGSGNAAGLFHGTVNGDDGLYARLFRAAALAAAREYSPALQAPSAQDVPDPPALPAVPTHGAAVMGQLNGLLRLHLHPGGLHSMQALVQRQCWPADYVQALSAAQASVLAGLPLSAPAWFYPAGGWINPPQWVRFALHTPGVQLRLHSFVQSLRRAGNGWLVGVVTGTGTGTDTALGPIKQSSPHWLQANVVVLAHAQAADTLLQTLGHAPLPLFHTRGQVTQLAHPAGALLQLPVAGDGYAVPLPFQHAGVNKPGLLCGATRQDGAPHTDTLPPVTAQDHQLNLARLQRLLALQLEAEEAHLQGRAAWRLHSADRLPIAGAVPLVHMPPGQRMDQARLLPREAGLFVLTALGARGLTLAPLLAQVVAAQACGAPWPLEQDLVDALDPARWRVRAARRQV